MWLPIFITCIIVGSAFIGPKSIKFMLIYMASVCAMTFIIIQVDRAIQTADIEVWSGRIEAVEHKEEWDEWHPPREERVRRTRTVNGKEEEYYETIRHPGYWEHHPAENRIKTSDDGWKNVSQFVDKNNKKTVFNDSYPNTNDELGRYYWIGRPSASTHSYENVVQASSSLYKHKGINPKDYDLPKYPMDVEQFQITRLVGQFPAFDALDEKHQIWNAVLNTEYKKQVNWIMVNLGADAEIDSAFALQESWENGNKNDYIISMSLDENFQVRWAYAFTWSESEILNIKVHDYFLNVDPDVTWDERIDYIAILIRDNFVRKEMADFKEYIVIEPTVTAVVMMVIMNCMIFVILYLVALDRYQRRW